MDAVPSLHPTDHTLSSYGLGKLGDGSAKVVNKHLEECPDCRRRVSEMSSDSFLDRARGVQPGGKSLFGASMASGTQSLQGSAKSPPPADSLPPGLVDHPDYEIKRELGRGGMGVVYLAHNVLMGRDEVLKVMGREIMERRGVLDRFLREIRVVGKLRHANIVTAYAAKRIGESIVFAMEYVEGMDLSRMVKSNKGQLPVAHSCNFVYQTALGLQHAHEEGLVHRDIKPANLMASRKGERVVIKVLDFGLAKAVREEKVDGGLTSVGQALGTPDYIAPEQILDAMSADIRADIYSLGGTLYYLLTGRPPFLANSLYDLYQSHISRDADMLNFVRPDVPTELAALVAKMLAKDPDKRFQTPSEVAQALGPFFKKGNSADARRVATEALIENPPIKKTTPFRNALSQSARSQSRPDHSPSESSPEPTVHQEYDWQSVVTVREIEDHTIRGDSSKGSVARNFIRVRRNAIAIIAAAVCCLGLVGAWSSGILRVNTPNGTIVLEGLSDDLLVEVDGERVPNIKIRKTPDGEPFLTLTAEKHGVRVRTRDGTEILSKEMKIDGGRELRVKLEQPPLQEAKREVKSLPALDPLPPEEAKREEKSLPALSNLGNGDWRRENGELCLYNSDRHEWLLFGSPEWKDYDFSFEAMHEEFPSGFSALFRSPDDTKMQRFDVGWHNLRESGMTFREGLEQYGNIMTNGVPTKVELENPLRIGQWYKLKVEVRGTKAKGFLNGKSLCEIDNNPFERGRVGIYTYKIGQGVARFRNITVTAPDGRPLWEGLPPVGPQSDSQTNAAEKSPNSTSDQKEKLSPGTEKLPKAKPGKAKAAAKGAANTNKGRERAVAPEWNPRIIGGNWDLDDQELVQSARATDAIFLLGNPSTPNYDINLEALATDADGTLQVFFNYNDDDNHYFFAIGNYRNTNHDVQYKVGGVHKRPGDLRVSGSIEFMRWNKLRVEVRGTSFKCFLNGKELFHGVDAELAKGSIGVGSYRTSSRFRKIEVSTPNGQILWRGLPNL